MAQGVVCVFVLCLCNFPSRKCSWDQMVKNSQLQVPLCRCIDVSCLLEPSSNTFVNSSPDFSNPCISVRSSLSKGKELGYLLPWSLKPAEPWNGNATAIWYSIFNQINAQQNVIWTQWITRPQWTPCVGHKLKPIFDIVVFNSVLS